ncbi:MAG: alpha/beta hydrolase [Verrucomicrobiaceae bacterium]|nr:alpha/beta hydrolase [Verrucomicrobiaceae bacterium]
MQRSHFIHQLGAVSTAMALASCRSMLPDATRPMRTLTYEPQAAGRPTELLVLLPGRFSDPEEFQRHGIVDLVRQRRPHARVAVPDLHLGYYMDRIPHICLHEEIVRPARQQGLRVTLMGVSLGGLGALIYTLRYPQDVREVLLLAPFLGEDDLTEEIEAAGGIAQWHPGKIVPRSKEEAIREMWAEMKARWHPGGPPMPMKLVTGRDDKHLRPNRLFTRSFLRRHPLIEIDGGHDWACWRRGADHLLA